MYTYAHTRVYKHLIQKNYAHNFFMCIIRIINLILSKTENHILVVSANFYNLNNENLLTFAKVWQQNVNLFAFISQCLNPKFYRGFGS